MWGGELQGGGNSGGAGSDGGGGGGGGGGGSGGRRTDGDAALLLLLQAGDEDRTAGLKEETIRAGQLEGAQQVTKVEGGRPAWRQQLLPTCSGPRVTGEQHLPGAAASPAWLKWRHPL